MLFSPDALRRAWRIVRRNGAAPGIDKISPMRFERDLEAEIARLRVEILEGTYQPQRVLRFYKLKPNGKRRPLSVWSVRDRLAQRVILDWLTPLLDSQFSECSFGFRPGRSVNDALRAVQRGLQANLKWVVDADIAECFDSVPCAPLLVLVRERVPSALAGQLIEAWLNTQVYDPLQRRRGQVTGVSQGSVLSPLLVNLYLDQFDRALIESAESVDKRLIRFADDLVILCQRRAQAEAVLRQAQTTLSRLHMQFNAEKTRVVYADAGFDFLGATFRGTTWKRSVTDE